MSLTFSSDGDATQERELGDGSALHFLATEIRRERTGVHAKLGIGRQNGTAPATILEYDTLNIGRSEERARLVKKAHAMLPDTIKSSLPLELLQHDFGTFCHLVGLGFEEARFQVTERDPSAALVPPTMLLTPYILLGGGTIIFAPPGQGKSWMLQAMALSLATGNQSLFPCVQCPVLYINLERSAASLEYREQQLARALGMAGRTGLSYLHVRGGNLREIGKKARRFLSPGGQGIVMVDSISRAGLGKLTDDDTGNAFIDNMNAMTPSWCAVAHTPRADATHSFGSVMYEAGEDIGIKLASEHQTHENLTRIGISLTVTKANDIKKPPPGYFALEFEEDQGGVSRLVSIRKANRKEFPELGADQERSRLERLKDFVLSVGSVSATDAANETGLRRNFVSDAFATSGVFQVIGKKGHKVLYGVKEQLSPQDS